MIPERPSLTGPSASAAWRDLREGLETFLARRVSPSDVDDVLQDVLVRVLTGAPVREDERWASWVFTIARNAAIDHHRRRGRRPTDTLDDDVVVDPSPVARDEEVLYAQAAACAASFVRELPEPYREALELTDLEGLSQRDVADRLGMSHSGLRTRVQRGRERLRELVSDCCTVELDVRSRVVEFGGPRAGCGTAGCAAPSCGGRA
jgi:RNA polymerase sigma-70 factor (ECF subfamily)